MSTPESSTILQSGSGPSWSGSGPLPSGPATDAATFGRFQVLGEAGSGAMGVVYAAYDPKLDRRVALKVLRGEANRGEARERTRREAVALAQVNHPNVVHVYEVGEAAKRLFIAMEYVDGPTLKVWQAGDHDQRRRLEVLQAIAAGLDAAHARGLVHRDVKPSNVLIGPSGRPRLIDFGLARAGAGGELDDGSVLGSDLTRTGRLLGTPAYMAPELMDGAAPSALSDQFSFCVTAYEVLFGVRPFPTDSLPVLRHAIERGLMAAPTSSAAGHEALLAILRRGMAADPAARWPSLGALADALGAQRSVQPEGLAPPLYVAVMALVGFLWVSVIYALLPRRA
ncbi:MAG: serine/threonine protein kinase, partial [Myxococcales bacterium]|nr:serine/threonine protein kinase [Myxococcales bacterium]